MATENEVKLTPLSLMGVDSAPHTVCTYGESACCQGNKNAIIHVQVETVHSSNSGENSFTT